MVPTSASVPLRAYLAGLAVLFVIAAGAAVVYGRVQARRRRRARRPRPTRASRRGSRRASSATGSRSCSRRSAAPRPTRASPRRSRNPEDCGLTFGGTDAYTTGHLDLVRTDGSVACSSDDEALDRGYGKRRWLERALSEPLLLAPATDPRTGEQVVLATAPVPKLGFVLAVVQPRRRRRAAWRADYGGPRGLEFVLADATGATVLTRSIEPERWIGKPCTPGDTRPRRPHAPVRQRDRPGRRLAGARRRRPRAGARRHPTAQPPRADDHPRRAAAVRLAAAVVHRRVARPLARLGSEVAPPRPRAPAGAPSRARARWPPWPAGSTSSGGARARAGRLPGPVRRQPAADVGARRRDRAASSRSTTPPSTAYGYTHDELLALTVDALERGRGLHLRKDGTTIEVNVASHAIDFRGRDGAAW